MTRRAEERTLREGGADAIRRRRKLICRRTIPRKRGIHLRECSPSRLRTTPWWPQAIVDWRIAQQGWQDRFEPKDQQWRKQATRRPCRVRHRTETESYQEYAADKHHAVASDERALGDRGAATDQSGAKPCQQAHGCTYRYGTHIAG